MTQQATSILELAGGAGGIFAIVEDFYRRIEADERMRSLYPADLEPGKEKLRLFLVQWLGGPPKYSEKYGHPRLRARHFPFVIGEWHAGRWLRYMREAWTANGVPVEAMNVVFERLGPLAHHMVNDKDAVPRTPLGDVRLS